MEKLLLTFYGERRSFPVRTICGCLPTGVAASRDKGQNREPPFLFGGSR